MPVTRIIIMSKRAVCAQVKVKTRVQNEHRRDNNTPNDKALHRLGHGRHHARLPLRFIFRFAVMEH